MTQWKYFVQTHLLLMTIYGLMWSPLVTFKHKMTLGSLMCYWLRDITLSSNDLHLAQTVRIRPSSKPIIKISFSLVLFTIVSRSLKLYFIGFA